MEEALLKRYIDYLDSLLDKDSREIFTNGGKEFASELMSRLFDNCENEARIYCQGFRKDLICEEPYWTSLQNYLNDPKKKLKVLVESSDHLNEDPIRLLFSTQKERNDDSIELRKINAGDKRHIEQTLDDNDCNFAVFDDKMFRFEYDPNGFKAFGSFNSPDRCRILTNLFDMVFKRAEIISCQN